MYESLEPHSHQWYTEAADALSRKVDQEFNRLLGEYQTPRTDNVGSYVDYHTGAVLTDFVGLPIPLNPSGPHPPEACKDPHMYARLTSNDQNVSNGAHKALRARAEEYVQFEHLNQTEMQERRKAEKWNKKIVHEVKRLRAVEKWLEGWQNILRKSFDFENGWLQAIFKLVEV